MLDLSLPLRLLLPLLADEASAELQKAADAERARPRPRQALLAALEAAMVARVPPPVAAPLADLDPAEEPPVIADETRAVSRWPDSWLDSTSAALAEELSRRGLRSEGTITIHPAPPPSPPEADAPPPPPPRGNCLVRPRSP